MARVSEREAEVLAALGEHLSNAQIAARLHLSVRTVETHVSSLLRKLDVADRRALAALAPSLVTAEARGAAEVVRGLPATWTPFVGRTRERAELIAALDASRLVTLLGPGGVGKTRLAAEVARELAPTLPLGATFVELVSTRPGFFLQTVASVLGVTERPGQALRDAVLARLRPGRSLLVLDNCEHLVDDTADFLTTLLGETTELLVLTTSRARIGVPGERVVPLPGLSLVAPSTGGAADSEAVALFFDRARMLDAQFDADPAAVGELCAQLDGMPLAIELATARSAALGITGLRAGLIDRLRLLSGGRSGDERHRSLRAVLDWSHELLDDEERTALRRLGRFAGEVDIAAASAVTGQPPAAVADLIGRLADESLLVHRQGGERWSLLETVRAYALDKLIEAGELDEVTDRYLRWAVDLSADLEDRLERGQPWRPAFHTVADDLRAALGLADGAVAAPLARSLGHLPMPAASSPSRGGTTFAPPSARPTTPRSHVISGRPPASRRSRAGGSCGTGTPSPRPSGPPLPATTAPRQRCWLRRCRWRHVSRPSSIVTSAWTSCSRCSTSRTASPRPAMSPRRRNSPPRTRGPRHGSSMCRIRRRSTPPSPPQSAPTTRC